MEFLALHVPISKTCCPESQQRGLRWVPRDDSCGPLTATCSVTIERKRSNRRGGGKREGRREKRNWNSLLTVCLLHRCLLFGVYSKKAALPPAGGQAPSGTGRVRAPGHHPSLTSPPPMSKDHQYNWKIKLQCLGNDPAPW